MTQRLRTHAAFAEDLSSQHIGWLPVPGTPASEV